MVITKENGDLKISAKIGINLTVAAVVALCTSVVSLYNWKAATDANRYTMDDARRYQEQQAQVVQDLWRAMRDLPPDEWRQRIVSLEAFRLKHTEGHQ